MKRLLWGVCMGAMLVLIGCANRGEEQGEGKLDPNSFRPRLSTEYCNEPTLVADPSNAPVDPSTGTAEKGTVVTLTASGDCHGTTPQYRFFINSGSGWQTLGPWTTVPTKGWDTSTWPIQPGYVLQVHVRRFGSTALWEGTSSYINYTIVEPAAGTCKDISFLISAPTVPVGDPVVLTPTSTCTIPQAEYLYLVQAPDSDWNQMGDWSTAAHYDWDTTGWAAGTYNVQVWVRWHGSTAVFEDASAQSSIVLTPSAARCGTPTISSVSPDDVAATIGDSLTINATADCTLSATADYKYWAKYPNGTWVLLSDNPSHPEYQGWVSGEGSNAFVWNTTGLPAGKYSLWVWSRANGNTSIFQGASALKEYHLLTDGACEMVSLDVPNPAGPSLAGPTVELKANARCGGTATASYRFFIKAPGGSWNSMGYWQAGQTKLWDTTGLTPGVYEFQAHTRASDHTTVAYEATSNYRTFEILVPPEPDASAPTPDAGL